MHLRAVAQYGVGCERKSSTLTHARAGVQASLLADQCLGYRKICWSLDALSVGHCLAKLDLDRIGYSPRPLAWSQHRQNQHVHIVVQKRAAARLELDDALDRLASQCHNSLRQQPDGSIPARRLRNAEHGTEEVG